MDITQPARADQHGDKGDRVGQQGRYVPALLAARIAGLSTVLAAVFLLGMLTVTALGVISREIDVVLIRNHEEWSAYLMGAFAVTAMPGSFHANAFVRVDILIGRAQGRLRSVALRVFLALSTVYVGVIAYYTLELARRSHDYGSNSVGGTEIALVIPQGAVAVGLLLFTAYLVCRLASRDVETATPEDGVRSE